MSEIRDSFQAVALQQFHRGGLQLFPHLFAVEDVEIEEEGVMTVVNPVGEVPCVLLPELRRKSRQEEPTEVTRKVQKKESGCHQQQGLGQVQLSGFHDPRAVLTERNHLRLRTPFAGKWPDGDQPNASLLGLSWV